MKEDQRLEIGKKYIVKSWDSLAKEYGLNCCGDIKTPAIFMNDMKKFCGQEVTIKSHHILDLYRIKEDNGFYLWEQCMLLRKDSIEYLIEKEKNYV